MKAYLRRLGSPDAINWLSIVALLIFQTSASLITSGVNFDRNFALFLAIRVGSLGAFIALLALGKWLLTLLAGHPIAPVVTISVFLFGITASTALFDWLLVVSQLAEESFLVRRIVLSLVGATVILVMVALIVTTARDYATSNTALQDAIDELEALRRGAQRRLQERQESLVDSIRDLIEDSMRQAQGSRQQANSVLSDLVDDVIRPLSHTLMRQASPPAEHHTSVSATIPWQQVVRNTLSRQPFTLVAFPGAIGAIIATFLVLSFGLRGVATTLAVAAGAAAVNALLGAVWRRLPSTIPVAARFIAFTAAIAPFLWLSVVGINAATGFNLAASPVRFTAWTLIVVSTWWVAAVASTVFQQLNESRLRLEATLDERKNHLVTLNATDHRLRRSVARALHGPIQEAVASSLRRLHDEPDLGQAEAFFVALKRRIDAALASIDPHAASPIDVLQEIDDLREVWEGSVDITSDIDSHLPELLASQPATAETVFELLREACQNAIRHGNASIINIEATWDQDSSHVLITVTNNGSAPGPAARQGMGTALFDTLAVSWSRESTPRGVVVHAAVPFLRS